jgi:hypothetical protein
MILIKYINKFKNISNVHSKSLLDTINDLSRAFKRLLHTF